MEKGKGYFEIIIVEFGLEIAIKCFVLSFVAFHKSSWLESSGSGGGNMVIIKFVIIKREDEWAKSVY